VTVRSTRASSEPRRSWRASERVSSSERLAAAGYRCHAVLDIGRITRVLHAAGRLSDHQAATLLPGITLA
jgi:hypothetical protein